MDDGNRRRRGKKFLELTPPLAGFRHPLRNYKKEGRSTQRKRRLNLYAQAPRGFPMHIGLFCLRRTFDTFPRYLCLLKLKLCVFPNTYHTRSGEASCFSLQLLQRLSCLFVRVPLFVLCSCCHRSHPIFCMPNQLRLHRRRRLHQLTKEKEKEKEEGDRLWKEACCRENTLTRDLPLLL